MDNFLLQNETSTYYYGYNMTNIIDETFIKRFFQWNNTNFIVKNRTVKFKEDECDDCNWILIQNLAINYANCYHGYVAIVVCLFGSIANLLNIAVLTRKDMACAPINRILTGLAVADIIVMLEYMTFAYYYYIELPGKLNFPYSGAVFILFHTHFTQIMHTISICLTLTLAIWRYLAIGYPDKKHILCSERRCTLAISLSYFLPILLCSPTYFVFEIKSTLIREDKELYVLYHTSLSDSVINNDNYILYNFWTYSVIVKLLPCIILTAISVWLINTLIYVKKHKEILRSYHYTNNEQLSKNHKITRNKAERRADRTTKMLIAVLLLFLITEFPQGIFGLLVGMRGKCFFLKCYQGMGEVMDILALLNGSINFILYCCMNQMFRTTFSQLFGRKIFAKWTPPLLSEAVTTQL